MRVHGERKIVERFEKAVPPGYHQWGTAATNWKPVAYGAYLFRVATAQGSDQGFRAGKVVRAPEHKTTVSMTTP